MKKIIAAIIAVAMLICCFALPCAADTPSGVHLVVEYNATTKLMKLSGTMAIGMGKWGTYYMLNPGRTRDEIPNHSDTNKVFSSYGEVQADNSGNFSCEFIHTGEPGECTLYFTTGYAQITRVIDTTTNVVSKSTQLEALRTMSGFATPTKSTVKELFFEKKNNELPNEMPVITPLEDIKGDFGEIFVDDDGDDATADGTKDHPYKTISAAIAAGAAGKGKVLYLREGTYPSSDGLNISNIQGTDELPFIVSSYGDEKVVVTSGQTLESEDFTYDIEDQDVLQRLNPDVLDKIMVVDLKEKYGINFDDVTSTASHRLFVGENKYDLARWPNSTTTTMREYTGELEDKGPDGTKSSGVIDAGYVSNTSSELGFIRSTSKLAGTDGIAANDTGIQFCIEDIRPFSWVDTGDICVNGKFYHDWTINSFRIVKFDPETRSIRTNAGLSWGCKYRTTNTFYYYNVLEELDTPGEWFLDKNTGKLYVYPTADFNEADIVYSSNTATMWTLENCKNVVINGINFEKSGGRALLVSNYASNGVVVQNCSFKNLGTGIEFRGSYSGVINSEFKDIAGKGVTIHGKSNTTKQLVADRQFIQNCTFYNTTGLAAYGIGEIISHNFISNNQGSCMNLTGNENIVEYNEIVVGPLGTTDAGSIYVNGNDMFARGTHVRYNYLHDARPEPQAIYFDDMVSECYAYGNIIANGGWIHIHAGSENTIYNNIIMNYQQSGGYSIYATSNTWTTHMGSNKWKVGFLGYGSYTKKLLESQGYGGNETANTLTGEYADRYPLLKTFAELMYQRIDEYVDGGSTTPKTSAITAYDYTYYKYGLYKTTQYIDLNAYLASVRDTYIANNVLINSKEINGGLPGSNGRFTSEYSGYVRTVAENNKTYTTDNNPFNGTTFADSEVYASIGIDEIPFNKIGLLSAEDYAANEEAQAFRPLDTTDISISANDLLLQWTPVAGAQVYKVEIARDKNFNDMVDEAETYDFSYKTDAIIESGTEYYWRVTTTATHKYAASGSVMVSETFKFKTMEESQIKDLNPVGVTVYSVDDDYKTQDTFEVTTYAYNKTDSLKDATIHIACYDEDGKLISTMSETVSIDADSFTSKKTFKFTAQNTNKIKFFVWSADGNMIPYTFVKTLQ